MSATNRSDVRHPDDFYSTPRFAIDAILPQLELGRGPVLDPCAGSGAILKALREGGHSARGLEIDPERASLSGSECRNALSPERWPDHSAIVTNPPFRHAMDFVLRALLECPKRDVAMLLRLGWLASKRRADFHRKHPCDVYILPRRPSFTGGTTDASEYAFFCWGPRRGNRWWILDVGP